MEPAGIVLWTGQDKRSAQPRGPCSDPRLTWSENPGLVREDCVRNLSPEERAELLRRIGSV